MILTRPIRITWKKHINEMSAENNIFIKNINKNATEKEFEDIFVQFGQVFSSKISYDENRNSRCYGYGGGSRVSICVLCFFYIIIMI